MTRTRLLDLVDRGCRLAEVTLSPGAIRAAARTRPLSVAAFRMAYALDHAGVNPCLVIDVGANRGQFAAAALHRWPGARVVSFEPLPGPAALLRAIPDPRLTVHEVALGRTDGTIKIFEHDYSPSSSALRSLDPAAHATSRMVPVRTLDTVLTDPTLRADSVLLKLDVQGFEGEVLAGAARSLRAVDAIVVEQALMATYEGQPLFGASHDQLTHLGFSFDRIVEWRRQAGQVIEFDALYRPSARS